MFSLLLKDWELKKKPMCPKIVYFNGPKIDATHISWIDKVLYVPQENMICHLKWNGDPCHNINQSLKQIW